MLSMHRESRGQVLAALREVFDGSWTRHVGVRRQDPHLDRQGGADRRLHDHDHRHHAVMATMGERFVLFGCPNSGPTGSGASARPRRGEAQMRVELISRRHRRVRRRPVTRKGSAPNERTRLLALATLPCKAPEPGRA